jgi:four helix bundle protein
MSAKAFEDLEIWQLSMLIAEKVYGVIAKTKLKSDFALSDQIRRASVSISSNIAEGFERNNNKDFRRFLCYSKGSAGEVRSQLYLAFTLKYIEIEEYKQLHEQLINIGKQLKGFMVYLAKWDEQQKTEQKK